MITAEKNLQEAVGAFDFRAPVIGVTRYGHGHINDTFCVSTQPEDNCCKCYILQRMSTAAFKHPEQLMANIVAITEYLGAKVTENGGDRTREAMEVIFTKAGNAYYADSDGGAWRAFSFVTGTCCYQNAETPQLFEASARAFGKFQRLLKDYPAETLYETIPRFHDTQDRLEKLKSAAAVAPQERLDCCREELAFALSREADCAVAMDALRKGILPLRVTHNDTKLNNVLIDEQTGEAVCVIDLDTTMPGLSINDFGDSIRFGANHSAEDEKDLTKVNFDMALFEVYTRGFLAETRDSLTDAECAYLPWGARLMTLECGIRFLTDYLDGDHYFSTQYPGQNLDRCRTQFKLVRDMEEQFDDMQAVVAKYRTAQQ